MNAIIGRLRHVLPKFYIPRPKNRSKCFPIRFASYQRTYVRQRSLLFQVALMTVESATRTGDGSGSGSDSSSSSPPTTTTTSSSKSPVPSTRREEHITIKESGNPGAPVAVLFGWAGCQDRYLSKYSKIYENLGCTVVRFTAPIAQIRSFSTYQQFARRVYDEYFALHKDDTSPVYFHVFSMNGCSLFVSLWDMIDTYPEGSSLKSRVKGIVFDSSPANVLPWQGANAVSVATMPPMKFGVISRNTYRFILMAVFSSHRALVWLQSFFDSSAFESHYAYFRILKLMDLPRHQLYLYSRADNICSDHSIESFQQIQRERDAKIRSQCWESSLHVQHLRVHPEEYVQLCEEFVKDTVSSK